MDKKEYNISEHDDDDPYDSYRSGGYYKGTS